ncbi:MAG: carbohydrate kinase family protein [Actinomycetota bacterium]
MTSAAAANHESRRGVLAAGSFIVDHVKMIDAWPEQDMLANISTRTMSNGGGPYNVLRDLRSLGAEYPLEAAGLLGDDADASWIRSDCAAHGIDVPQLGTTDRAATSYTDAMCVEHDGRRTFFHHRGANAVFAAEHVDLTKSDARIFLLGYLVLLDAMDRLDGDGRTDASRLLEMARSLGFTTAVETVSAVDASFRDIVFASLPHVDLLFLNEVEASLLLEREVEVSGASLQAAAEDVATLGAPGRVIVHCSHGAVCREPDGTVVTQPSLDLPTSFIAGATGAGDAFTAGFLHSVHEGATTQTSLLQGVCVAAQSLTHPAASGGVRTLSKCLSLPDRFEFREF